MPFQNCVVSLYQDNVHSKIIYLFICHLWQDIAMWSWDLLSVTGWPQFCGDSLVLSP